MHLQSYLGYAKASQKSVESSQTIFKCLICTQQAHFEHFVFDRFLKKNYKLKQIA